MAHKIVMYLTMYDSVKHGSLQALVGPVILCDTTYKCPHVKEANF